MAYSEARNDLRIICIKFSDVLDGDLVRNADATTFEQFFGSSYTGHTSLNSPPGAFNALCVCACVWVDKVETGSL